MAAKRKKGKWLQAARASMEKRGTVGAFGAATSKKIARAKKHGGLEKKRAIFAQNMKRLAARRKKKGRSKGRS